MPAVRQAAFIRNVMVGREGLTRAVLVDLAQRAGGARPRAYLSTGNLTFDLPAEDVPGWVASMEEGIERVIGRREQVFVRSIGHLESLVAADPFAASPFADPHERAVSLLPPGARLGAERLPLCSRRGDLIVFAATATEAFTVTRVVDGRVTGSGALIERETGCRITTRAWGTIERIVKRPE